MMWYILLKVIGMKKPVNKKTIKSVKEHPFTLYSKKG